MSPCSNLSGRIMLIYFFIGIILIGMLGVIVKVKFSKPKTQAEMEANFTPEQKALLTAIRNATAELTQATHRLEQSKREFTDMMTAANAIAISKGVDPNVHITWLSMNGEPIFCGDKQAWWGFRDDGVVIWKRP